MREIKFISFFCYAIIHQARRYEERKQKNLLLKYNLDSDRITKNVHIVNIQNIRFGEGSYMNGGFLHAGVNSKITIGRWCAIGYNVSIKAKTHNKERPTGEFGLIGEELEMDINIGDYVWIGDNVFIREGVTIGNNVIIGANSVVTKDVTSNNVMGGVPAALIRKR